MQRATPIFISPIDKHPKVGFYRGTRHKNYQFFGPYPSAHVVRDSLNLLKKIFKVRQCANATYRARSRLV
ncbi:Excinuclease ABC subunit C [uncultured Gammaproteobacteria bacterium]|nr:Excinuclease ABC subunit C [uncultured Gammaproteobacteria bacterium]